MSPTVLSTAREEWRSVLGAHRVLESHDDTRRAGTGTFATTASVAAILRPRDRNEVQQCVRIANRFHVPIYPVSTGRNWGYGSSVPVRDAVLLHLGDLNRIVDFDEDLAYVTVEPGVTQRQLFAYLRSRNSRLWMDATGSSPDCSIIGNALERGFGHTPAGDHCSHVCGLEVVLPTGECIETGFGRFAGAHAGPLARWGLGPSLDGLFSQSNLGIVTRMSVWLMPAPECFQGFFLQSEGSIGPVVDALRPLRLNGTIRSVVHLGNDFKVMSNDGAFPWKGNGGQTPLTRGAMDSMRPRLGIARWSGSGGLYGSKATVRDARSQLRRALKGKVDRLMFVGDKASKALGWLDRPYRLLTGRDDLGRAARVLPPLLGLLKGSPTNDFLPSAYWRKPHRPPSDPNPDGDRCGLLWCSPVAPALGRCVEEIAQIAEETTLAHGFEPIVSASLLTERSTVTTIALTFDRDVPGEDMRATCCYRELTEKLLSRGYPPYRLNVSSMDYMTTGDEEYGRVLGALKAALDPQQILSPGRYEWSPDR